MHVPDESALPPAAELSQYVNDSGNARRQSEHRGRDYLRHCDGVRGSACTLLLQGAHVRGCPLLNERDSARADPLHPPRVAPYLSLQCGGARDNAQRLSLPLQKDLHHGDQQVKTCNEPTADLRSHYQGRNCQVSDDAHAFPRRHFQAYT